jgi:hypothetical protein
MAILKLASQPQFDEATPDQSREVRSRQLAVSRPTVTLPGHGDYGERRSVGGTALFGCQMMLEQLQCLTDSPHSISPRFA